MEIVRHVKFQNEYLDLEGWKELEEQKGREMVSQRKEKQLIS